MKRSIAILLMALLSVNPSGFNQDSKEVFTDSKKIEVMENIGSKDELNENVVKIANPFKTCKNLKSAQDIVGFGLKVPDVINGIKLNNIQAIDNYLIESIYGDGKIIIRKAKDKRDISGDYNVYDNIRIIEKYGKNISLKSNLDLVFTATFIDGDYSYAVLCKEGMDLEDILNIISSIK